MQRRRIPNRSPIIYMLIVLLLAFVVSQIGREVPEAEELSITSFVQHLEAGDVKELSKQGNIYSGKLNNGEEFEIYISNDNFYEYYLKDLVDASNLEFIEKEIPQTPWYIQLLPTIILLLMMVGIWYLFMMRTQGSGSGMMNYGKSKARLHKEDGKQRRVTFDDVAGLQEEKEELAEVVDFLKNPRKYTEIGARIPKGVLMVGDPGTGKTYLSRAVAGEAGVPFYSISGSEFVEMFVGVGASRVRDLFSEAKKNAPCIVFIDEIDAVGRKRSHGQGGSHDEREQTLNQLLVEMDGFEENEGIIVIAATNRPDILDPALTRPGRFDRTINVGLPDVKAREEILQVHVRNKKLASDVDLKAIAKTTSGFTPALLENLTNEAAILAARHNQKLITREIMEEAAIKVVAGPEKRSKIVPENEKIITAYHEAGHAIVSRLMPYTDKVHMITIIPRGQAGGFTAYIPEEENSYLSRDRLVDRLAILLGGRAGEEVVLTDISSGASNDIERATQLARYMVTKFGMSKKLGPVNYEGDPESPLGDLAKPYSEEVQKQIDKEVMDLVNEAHKKAVKIIEDNVELLYRLAHELLEKETINSDEFEELFQKYHVDDDPRDSETGDIINYDYLIEKGVIRSKEEEEAQVKESLTYSQSDLIEAEEAKEDQGQEDPSTSQETGQEGNEGQEGPALEG